MIILIDTREKLPYKFNKHKTKKKSLAAGDYSVYGYEKYITVERKSIGNLLAWFHKDFKRQIKKLHTFEHKCIVVDGKIRSYNTYGDVKPENIAYYAGLCTAISIPIVFCDTRKLAAIFVESFLEHAVKVSCSK